MTKTTMSVGLLAALLFGCADIANAQVAPAPLTRGYFNVNFGWQPQQRTFTTSASYDKYGEKATFEAVQDVSSGPLFDVNGGMLVMKNVAIGARVFDLQRQRRK